MHIILVNGSLYSKIRGDDVLFTMALERRFGKVAEVSYIDAGDGYFHNIAEAQLCHKGDIVVTNNVLIWGDHNFCFEDENCLAYIYREEYGEILHVTESTDYHIDDLVDMYTSGLLFDGVPEELTAMVGIISRWLLHNTTIEADDDFQETMYRFAEYLTCNNVRFTKNKGTVICEGEVSICPPEVVDKVKKALG